MASLDELPPRMRKKVVVDENGCWVWTGYRSPKGYGQVCVDKKIYRSHRYAYTVLVGPIPEGLTIDHLCRNRGCVNPAHLEAVTHRENCDRSPNTLTSLAKSRTHCNYGHPFDDANTGYERGRRVCLTCRRRWTEVSMARRKAKQQAAREYPKPEDK